MVYRGRYVSHHLNLSIPSSLNRCDWTAITSKPPNGLLHQLPSNILKKMKEAAIPKCFEVEPFCGILYPGDVEDIKIRFMPSEQVSH